MMSDLDTKFRQEMTSSVLNMRVGKETYIRDLSSFFL